MTEKSCYRSYKFYVYDGPGRVRVLGGLPRLHLGHPVKGERWVYRIVEGRENDDLGVGDRVHGGGTDT